MTSIASISHSEGCLRELARLDSAECAGKRTILFVCTGNAIRSQMAEALINHDYGDKWAAFSGGTMPMGVHEDTMAIMREIGIDMSGQFAKDVDLFKDCAFDQVVVLCSDAGRNCPVFFHSDKADHLSFDDPLSPDFGAGGIFFSYKSELRSLRDEMRREFASFIKKLDGPATESCAEAAPGSGGLAVALAAWLSRTLAALVAWRREDRAILPADGRIAARYRAFKTLLAHNHAALEHIAQLEQTYFGGKTFNLASIRTMCAPLLRSVFGIVHSLAALTGRQQRVLVETLEHIEESLAQLFDAQPEAMATRRLVLDFPEIVPEMKDIVGSKAANLAVIGNSLKLPVPEGFAITSHACEHFLAENGLTAIIQDELSRFVPDDLAANEKRSRKLQALIRSCSVPLDLANEITAAFDRIELQAGADLRVAMRSSAVGEDTEPTFAGQYETVLNVRRQDLLDAYKEVLASKYSPQAINYRMQYGLDDSETPMCVAAVAMIDASASGVVYSRDPAQANNALLKVNSLWGLGEQLVDGSASSDTFLVDRDHLEIRKRTVANKPWRLASLEEGGTRLERTPAGEQAAASLDDELVRKLGTYCLAVEDYFGVPQDIEWACDRAGTIFLLQSRPLFLPEIRPDERMQRDYPGHPILLEQGVMASPGVVAGVAHVVLSDDDLNALPEDAILVVKTAAPKYARVAGVIRGLIAATGSTTSHMASVAREFGLPAIVDARDAMRMLKNGDRITLAASSATVYQGVVEDLLRAIRPARKVILDSPVHRRMRAILDLITPLNLSDTASPSFSPEGCRSIHDIIRYAHEQAVLEMFGLSEDSARSHSAIRLVSRLPISLYLIDLGGGLQDVIAKRGGVTADNISCRPLLALWRGFTHPGVTWEGTLNTGKGKLSAMLAAPALAEFGEQPGGDSYAIVSGDYLNFSAKFAYHFATIDALCGDASSQNYASLQFSGGAGSYYGRTLRVQLMATILEQLDFEVLVTGDVLKAVFARHDACATAERLDLLGRLLASCKLLDMTLSSPREIELYCSEFFKGNYGFLSRDDGGELNSVYVQGGHWTRVVEDGHACCVQDGSKFGGRLGARIAGTFAKAFGIKDTEFLDNIAAYYHFPLAILKNSEFVDGAFSARIRLVAGEIDRAGGIAFGIRDWDNYFVLRINALENNVILFEFRNGKRYKLVQAERNIDSDKWYELRIEVQGTRIEGYLNGESTIFFDTGKSLAGFLGLWTKSDSTTWFDAVAIEKGGVKTAVEI